MIQTNEYTKNKEQNEIDEEYIKQIYKNDSKNKETQTNTTTTINISNLLTQYTNIYEKILRYENHCVILHTHLTTNSTPKTLKRENFPAALLGDDKILNNKINQIINETQTKIMETTITHLAETTEKRKTNYNK